MILKNREEADREVDTRYELAIVVYHFAQFRKVKS
jgi:hypothetical protein